MTTIVLVDDHKIVRQGIKGLLEDEPELKVIWTLTSLASGCLAFR
jgi:DNA-binding NarL/FixJ family response regulator